MKRRTAHKGFSPSARRGIALVMTLVVVLLITTLLAQFGFTTSLELRSLQTQKETMQARSLARSAFKAVQGFLLQDESDFLFGYRQLQSVLALSAVPWEEGLLTKLEIEPLDPLFNLNRLAKARPGEPKDVLLHEIFQKTLIPPVTGLAPAPSELPVIDPSVVAGAYAALFDWIDPDNNLYTAIPGALGAESAEYFTLVPERAPPNRALARLSEIRLVRGVMELGVTWEDWRKRFTIYEGSVGQANLYPGLLNINGATHEQIVAFLEARRLERSVTDALPGTLIGPQQALNEYADHAEDIAIELIPADTGAPVLSQKLTKEKINEALTRAGVKSGFSKQVFSTADEYFRVRIVTLVGATQAELEAVLRTPRDENDRTASAAEVLEYTLR